MSEKKDYVCVGFLSCKDIWCRHCKLHSRSDECYGKCKRTLELERLEYKCVKVIEEE